MAEEKQPYPEACSEWEEDLAKFHPDDLSQERKEAMGAHLKVCPNCAQVRADYVYHSSMIRRMVEQDYQEALALIGEVASIVDPGLLPWVENRRKSMEPNLEAYKMILFDSDSTINKAFTTEILPGRREKIRALNDAGMAMAVLTNQAGLVWLEATGQGKYPTVERLAAQIMAIARETTAPLHIPWYIALYDERAVKILDGKALSQADEAAEMQASIPVESGADVLKRLHNELHYALHPVDRQISIDPTWRKPEPGMIIAACTHAGILTADALFVGDMGTDKAAADAAGCHFMWAWQFFGDPAPEEDDGAF